MSLSLLLRRVAGRVSPLRHRHGSALVLTYHQVLDAPDEMRPGVPSIETFESQMQVLASECNVIPLADVVSGLEDGRLPPAAVAITFDDGYADNHRNALPVLQRLGLPATFFVASSYLDGGCMFNDAVYRSL